MNNLYFLLICVVLAILFGKMINVDTPKGPRLLFRTTGYVGGGNFSYFYLFYVGPIILNLTSLSGDADLYVSEKNMYPTYYPEIYDQHSATCGEDVMELPENLEGLTAVGVYGHAESNDFMLEGYENLNIDYPLKQWALIDTEIEFKNFKAETSEIMKKMQTSENNIKKSTQSSKKKKKKSSSSIPGIFSVLEILQLIFL